MHIMLIERGTGKREGTLTKKCVLCRANAYCAENQRWRDLRSEEVRRYMDIWYTERLQNYKNWTYRRSGTICLAKIIKLQVPCKLFTSRANSQQKESLWLGRRRRPGELHNLRYWYRHLIKHCNNNISSERKKNQYWSEKRRATLKLMTFQAYISEYLSNFYNL